MEESNRFFCLICYKPSNPNHYQENQLKSDVKELLKRFYKLIGRYLVTENEEDSIIETLIDHGMAACEDCFNILISFCDLFNQMKNIELLINWKIWTLKNIMHGANRVPERVEAFQEAVNDLLKTNKNPETEIKVKRENEIDSILITKYRRKFIRKCIQKRRNSAPSLCLRKLETKTHKANMKFTGENANSGDGSSSFLQRIHNNSKSSSSKRSSRVKKVPAKYSPSSPAGSTPITSRRRPAAATDNYFSEKKSLSPPGSMKCKICKKSFGFTYSLQRHIRIVHDKITFKCGYCEKSYSQRYLLANHINSTHFQTSNPNIPLPFKANVFKKRSSEPEVASNMKNTANLVLSKENCQNTVAKNKLKKKINSGTGRKAASTSSSYKFKCGDCGKLFGSNFNLRRHRISKICQHLPNPDGNATEKEDKNFPFFCTICNKVFPYLGSLQLHQAEHERTQFECGYCSTTFARRDLARRHSIKRHILPSGAPASFNIKVVGANVCIISATTTTNEGTYHFNKDEGSRQEVDIAAEVMNEAKFSIVPVISNEIEYNGTIAEEIEVVSSNTSATAANDDIFLLDPLSLDINNESLQVQVPPQEHLTDMHSMEGPVPLGSGVISEGNEVHQQQEQEKVQEEWVAGVGVTPDAYCCSVCGHLWSTIDELTAHFASEHLNC